MPPDTENKNGTVELDTLLSQSLASQIQNLKPTETRVPLRNDTKPIYNFQKENYRHRLVIELAAKGFTCEQISERTQYHVNHVRTILKQDFAQQPLVENIKETADQVDQQVFEIVKKGCLLSAKRLLSIVEDDKSNDRDAISAAEKFLERRYGKANQPINRGTDVDLNKLTDAELAKMLPTSGTGTT